MDHEQIERDQIIDRYLMGKLEPAVTTRFEEHYLHCQDCLDQLELAEKLQRGLKRVAATEALERTATRQLAVFAWLSRLSRSGQLGVLLTALLVTISLPTGMILRMTGQRDGDFLGRLFRLQPALDGPEQPEARLAGLAAQRDHEAHLPVFGGAGVAGQRAHARNSARLEP